MSSFARLFRNWPLAPYCQILPDIASYLLSSQSGAHHLPWLSSLGTVGISKRFSDQLIQILPKTTAMSCADYFPLPTSFGEAVPSLLWFIKGLICLFGAGLAAVCIFVFSVADSDSFCFI